MPSKKIMSLTTDSTYPTVYWKESEKHSIKITTNKRPKNHRINGFLIKYMMLMSTSI